MQITEVRALLQAVASEGHRVGSDWRALLLPPDTTRRHCSGEPVGARQLPSSILGRPVHLIRVAASQAVGIQEYLRRGYPGIVTRPQRSLVDGLRAPRLGRGIDIVLAA